MSRKDTDSSNPDRATICVRCRGDARDCTALGHGPGEKTCVYCGFQGSCPKCGRGSAIEGGQCTTCAFKPTLYLRVHTHGQDIPDTEDDSWRNVYAKIGCALAVQLSLPPLKMYAVGTVLRICTVPNDSDWHDASERRAALPRHTRAHKSAGFDAAPLAHAHAHAHAAAACA